MLDHPENTEENKATMRSIATEIVTASAMQGLKGTPTHVILGGTALALITMARGTGIDKESLKLILMANIETVYKDKNFDPVPMQ